MSPQVLPSGSRDGGWFSSWYVVSIDSGHIAPSPQSGPRWRPAFKMEPVLSFSSFTTRTIKAIVQCYSHLPTENPATQKH